METFESTQQIKLQELASVFFKLGMVAFGGPVAHIAMMEEEIVKRRRWLTTEKLLDLLGVTSLIPGPNSTELAIHIGYEQASWQGLFIAGFCFILPAMTLVWIFAAVYAKYQALPQIEALLYGIKPLIAIIIIKALWKLGSKAVKDIPTAIASIAVIMAFFAGVNEILLLLLAGLGVMLIKSRIDGMTGIALIAIAQGNIQVNGLVKPFPSSWWSVFLFFLKVGSVLYGSGYVLLAFLQRDLVERSQWLTSQQLLDAIAIGQLTPGPVFTTATFIGYLLAGNLGAIAATVGIFLPAFILVGLINPWVDKLRQSVWLSGFLDGVNAASLGLMAAVTYTLARTAVVDWFTVLLLGLGAIALFRWQISSMWLVVFGGTAGLLWQWLG
ncbi:chromate efflux transporter [Pleurocapsales cyanobacterium LEGE 10410]|nr:chromate efflux transporter [Pleurocapsales cyanobacterium LEGE 10410]